MVTQSGRLQLKSHKAFCAIFVGASSLQDELRIGSESRWLRHLGFIASVTIVAILACLAIALLIARRSKK